jgi:hypothetical protein
MPATLSTQSQYPLTRRILILGSCYTLAVLGIVRIPKLLASEVARAPVMEIASGTITMSTIWRAGVVHRISGPVRVTDGATLTIEPGARVEGTAGAALVVERTGRIQAVGTLTEPIVLGCPASSIATRDCWGGLVIAGNAPVNGGTLDSPPARGTGASGCAQRTDDALAVAYGGCASDDNSGTMQYVRVEFGVRGLQLLGVGTGTQLEYVQVHGAGSGGITLRGGTVDLRHMLVTSSGPTGLRWSGGWVGRGQHLLVQVPAEGGVGIDGTNDAAAPALTPRSAPELFNVSVLRLRDVAGASVTTGLRLADGSGARISNLLIAGFDVALDVDGASSCGLIGTGITVTHGIIAGTGALGDPDADAACAGGAATEDALLTDATLERVTDAAQIDGLLRAGFDAVLPDFRSLSAVFLSRAIAPPANGFYLPSAYVGGGEPLTIGGTNIPWHSGWTRDDVVPAVSAFGTVSGTVSSPQRGAFNGARVEAGGVSTVTDATGAFILPGVLAGAVPVLATTGPSGCTLPASRTVTVVASATTNGDLTVGCSALTIAPSTLRLAYICGRTFRVRNPNDAAVTVTWDVFGTSETGTLALPARPLSGSFSETFFETVATGTVRLFYNGSQSDVKANGGFACTP